MAKADKKTRGRTSITGTPGALEAGAWEPADQLARFVYSERGEGAAT